MKQKHSSKHWLVETDQSARKSLNSIEQSEFDHDEVAREQNQDEIDGVAGSESTLVKH